MALAGIAREEAKKHLESVKAQPAFAAARRLARDVQLHVALNDAFLKLESQVYDFRQVPRVSGVSSQDFLHNYYSRNLPVIIEDVASHWPATRLWTFPFLRERFGTQIIRYQMGRSRTDHRDCFVDHTREGTFGDFLSLLESPNPLESPPYLIAHDRILDRPPFNQLISDIEFDGRYFNASPIKPGEVFLWIGTSDSSTPLHRDLGNVYLAQVSGHKLVRMIPSKQLHLVYNEVGYHSEADLNSDESDRFPLLKDAWTSEVTLNPGDLLFIPIGWWHSVKCLDRSISVTGNNFCFPNAFTRLF